MFHVKQGGRLSMVLLDPPAHVCPHEPNRPPCFLRPVDWYSVVVAAASCAKASCLEHSEVGRSGLASSSQNKGGWGARCAGIEPDRPEQRVADPPTHGLPDEINHKPAPERAAHRASSLRDLSGSTPFHVKHAIPRPTVLTEQGRAGHAVRGDRVWPPGAASARPAHQRQPERASPEATSALPMR